MTTQEKIGFKEFQKQFSSEDVCEKYLFQLRWAKGFVCPKCGGTEYYYLKTRKKYQCKTCKRQTSVTAGTVMDRSHLELTTWFLAMYLVSRDKRGYSALQLSTELELPYNTAWFLLHRIRKAMTSRDENYMLSGIIEMDDTYFGKKNTGGKRGRGTNKIKVLVGLSKSADGKPQFVKMQVVSNLKSKTIGGFASKSIKSGSTVQSDAYHSYRRPLKDKYLHQYEVFDADSEMLRWLHIVIGNAKSFVMGTFHGLGSKHIQCYLDEFCYRFNRRKVHSEIFARLLSASVSSSPLRFADLT